MIVAAAEYRYALEVGNDGDVPLDSLVVIDTLPVEMRVSDVTTGGYTGLTDFAPGEGVRVSYEKNTAPGRVINPDNTGFPVAAGDMIQNCAALTAVYTAGPVNVTRDVCLPFTLIAGPAIAIAAADSTPLGSDITATATLSGGAPTGSITFEVFGGR